MAEGILGIDPSIYEEVGNIGKEQNQLDQRTVWFVDSNAHGMQALSPVIAKLVKENFSNDVNFQSYGTADSALSLLSSGENIAGDQIVIPDLIVVGNLINSSEGLKEQAEFEQAINQLPIANKPKIVQMEHGMLSMDFAKIIGDNLPAKAELTMIPKVEEPEESSKPVEVGQMDRAA